jgi:glutamine amidotransferase
VCELFGYSSATANSLALPLQWFRVRGGQAADNRDGWGIAWRSAEGMRIHKEPVAATGCNTYENLARHLTSDLVIAHVRKANPPTANVLANTHPFQRDCCGRAWVFAHNGVVPAATTPMGELAAQLCAQPLGDTDSEQAFCMVLERIAVTLSAASAAPERDWLEALARAAETLASSGRFNFVMSDGVHLIAYGHDRLHSLHAAGAVFVATEPLTASPDWHPFAPGELRVYLAGQQVARILTHPRAGPSRLGSRSIA